MIIIYRQGLGLPNAAAASHNDAVIIIMGHGAKRMAEIRSIAGVLLAGGLGRRMGHGAIKPLRHLAGRTLLAHAIDRSRPQVDTLALNVNAEPECFTEYGLPIIADPVAGFVGPLAGILGGMEWAAGHGSAWVVSFACDAPFLPRDLVTRLIAVVERKGADMGCARSGEQAHPVFTLWPTRLARSLHQALIEEDIRKVGHWMARYRVAYADWPILPFDPFLNVNTPEELAAAEQATQLDTCPP